MCQGMKHRKNAMHVEKSCNYGVKFISCALYVYTLYTIHTHIRSMLLLQLQEVITVMCVCACVCACVSRSITIASKQRVWNAHARVVRVVENVVVAYLEHYGMWPCLPDRKISPLRRLYRGQLARNYWCVV